MKFRKFLAFTVLIFLFFGYSVTFCASGKINEEVVSVSLSEKLTITEPGEIFNLIIQFEDELKKEDLRIMDILDFEVVQAFHIIPGVHAYAKKEAIIALSNYERTYWIETNDKLEYNLEVSTSVINATNTWSRIITDFGVKDEPIDGTDVTVVVADTGIDATHPDLDYHEKVILNLKKDINHPGMWKEMENTDIFFGHGTHCAGIIGGTGEASAGARRGVAPNVNLIGLSIGDPWETNEVGGLEWVYDNSHPNANPYNIRVVSNSWGYEDIDDNFKDAVMEATRKLTYENNVVVVFAASNDGEEDHDGHVSTTNMYGNVPVAISVAASQRDGSGMADFSSRGHRDNNETWPDITAPGVSIMSARDSNGKMGKSNTDNPYYIPASGTSMATPHIAGVVALLFQACPDLTISEVHDDSSTQESGYWEDPFTRIHEAEYILKATSDFMPFASDNGVPDNFSYSLLGRPHDFAQGYGLVNVERAVGVALTLSKLRSEYPEATVEDALKSHGYVINDTTASRETDVLVASWMGEYTLQNDQNAKPTFVTNQAHYVYISNESKKLILDLSFPPIELEKNTIGTVTLTIDYNDDGSADWTGSIMGSDTLSGHRHDEIDISSGEFSSHRGSKWAFSIYGYAVKTSIIGQQPPSPGGFRAPTIEYATSVQQVLDFSASQHIFVDFVDLRSSVAQLEFGEPTSEYIEGEIELYSYEFNLSRAFLTEEPPPPVDRKDSYLIALVMDIVLAFIVIIALIRRQLKKTKIDAKITTK